MLLNSKKIKKVRRLEIKGFTLVEMLVSIGVMVVMFSVVLSSQSTYTSTAALNNIADDVYLSLRQAQVYGVGVKEFSPGTVEFDVSYGMSFNKSSSGSNDAYIFFADRGAKNTIYDSGWDCPTGGSSECISKTSFSYGVTVDEMCFIRNNDTTMCNIGRIDISFARPNPEAQVIVFNQNGAYMNPQPGNIKGVSLKILSPNGKSRVITVYKTGQISIQ